MDENLKDLIARRQRALTAMRDALDSKDDDGFLTVEARTVIDNADKDLDILDKAIERAKRDAVVDNASAAIAVDIEASQRVTLTGEPIKSTATPEYTAAFVDWVRNGTRDQQLTNAMTIGTSTQGGYTVPQSWADTLIQVRDQWSPIEAQAAVLETEGGSPFNQPTMDDTAGVATIISEGAADTDKSPTVGTVKVGAWTYGTGTVPISIELLADNGVNLVNVIPAVLGTRLGRGHNVHFVGGNGTTQPNGIVTGATNTVTSAVGASIAADDLISLQHACGEAYRAGGKFVFADTTLQAIRKLKDTTGRYLFNAATDGMADTILGKEFLINDQVPAVALSARAVGFFNFSQMYLVRRAGSPVLNRLNEIAAVNRQAVFLGFDRVDGQIVNQKAGAVLVQKSS